MATINQKKSLVSDLLKESLSFEILTAPHSALGAKKLARQALKKILRYDHQKNLLFSDFTTLKEDPSISLSLSHTTPHWTHPQFDIAAAATLSKKLGAGVGIDLEWAYRPMALGAEKYFQNAEDQNSRPFYCWSLENKRPIESRLLLWSQKEAAFKSLRQWQKKIEEKKRPPLLLKDIWIQGPYFGLLQFPHQVLGQLYSFEYFFYDSFIVSLAYLYPQALANESLKLL